MTGTRPVVVEDLAAAIADTRADITDQIRALRPHLIAGGEVVRHLALAGHHLTLAHTALLTRARRRRAA